MGGTPIAGWFAIDNKKTGVSINLECDEIGIPFLRVFLSVCLTAHVACIHSMLFSKEF